MVACKVSSIIPHDKEGKTEPKRIPPTNRKHKNMTFHQANKCQS